jgi:large subunit ribosomal protein L14
MIQLLTKVNIVDNSGGVIGRCIKILKPHDRDYAKIGDLILVSILEIAKVEGDKKGGSTANSIRDTNKIKKGTMFKALVVRTKSKTFSSAKKKSVSFDENAVVLIKSNPGVSNTAQKKTNIFELPPIGTRIKGPISILLTPSSTILTSSKDEKGVSKPITKVQNKQLTSFTKVTSLCSTPL